MPLIDPVTMSNSSDWKTKLLGKTLSDSGSSNETSFARSDLPKEHRVLQPDAMKTMDHKPERLNVHVDKEGVVRDVSHG